jgi:hypothetical protein
MARHDSKFTDRQNLDKITETFDFAWLRLTAPRRD